MIRVLIRSKPDRKFLSLYYVTEAGREVSKSAGTADTREAERAAARWEAELVKSRGVDGKGWDWFRLRFTGEHLAKLPKNSRRLYRTALNHYERLLAPASVLDVTASTISQFQSKLIDEGKPLTTISSYLTHLRVALNWAAKVAEMLERAPHFAMPRLGKRRMAKGRAVTEAEYRKMLEACSIVCTARQLPQFTRLLNVLQLSGLRLAEALRLSWDSPPIQVALDSRPYPHIVFWLEGHKAKEDIASPLTPDFAAWLENTPAEQRQGLVAPVTNDNGQPMAVLRVSKVISAIGKEAGVKVSENKFASAHDLRRAFASRWASRVRPITLQRMMRHANLSTTMKFYVEQSAADAGAELWPGVPTVVPKPPQDSSNHESESSQNTAENRPDGSGKAPNVD